MKQKLALIGCCLALPAVAAEPGAFVRQLDESGRRSEAARAIQQGYVRSLELHGKTAAQAIEILLIAGFRCGLTAPEDNDYLGPVLKEYFKDVATRVHCVQDESKIDAACPTLTLTLDAQWSHPVAVRADMLDQLDSARIKTQSARCPPPLVGSAEFVVQRARAEKTLEQQVDQLALVGTKGKQAFDRLLASGFACGIRPAGEDGFEATLACRRWPSRIDWCFDAELLLGMRWKQPHRTPTQRVRDIQGAAIESTKSQCLLPHMSSDVSA